jgi:hypothetical protein
MDSSIMNSLHAKDKAAVRTEHQILVLHGIAQLNQVTDVQSRLVLEMLRGRVEVDDVDRAPRVLTVSLQIRAIRRLSMKRCKKKKS